MKKTKELLVELQRSDELLEEICQKCIREINALHEVLRLMKQGKLTKQEFQEKMRASRREDKENRKLLREALKKLKETKPREF